MTPPALPPDDLPTAQPTAQDADLRSQLEQAAGRWFYEACDGVVQALLVECGWQITTTANALTLVIHCPTPAINWRVLNHTTAIATALERFSNQAKICVYPPDESDPFEIRVDELDIYRDSLD